MKSTHVVGPDGWRYQDHFLTSADEQTLLHAFSALPFQSARYKEWTAKRRLVSYGGRYDFASNMLEDAEPVPEFLLAVRAQAARWAGLEPDRFTHASVAEYAPGTQLGWHRDVPDFETVIGISVLGHARMRFRPYPPRRGQRAVLGADLAPRSIYVMTGAVRWAWQHAISPTSALRYSITFRSLRTSTHHADTHPG